MRVTKVGILLLAVLLGVMFIGGLMWGLPTYSVWQQGLSGEAALKKAEQTKQISIEAAKAKLDAAKYLNLADIERAKGVAEANEIISDGLKGNVEYLQYLWVQGLTEDDGNKPTIIYIPTEAGLPILEAGKRDLERF